MIKHLKTVEEVIDELGGPKAVSKLTGRKSTSAVPTWKWRKRFPSTTYPVMKSALQERGKDASDKLWGMDAPVSKSETAA